jgi:CRISPR/Cas system CSM-associated protein Csm3 (group 7 of RAMP superfamily)
MHEMNLCNCLITFQLTTATPLLIGGAPRALHRTANPQSTKRRGASDFANITWGEPKGENLISVSLHWGEGNGEPAYLIPGSSLRGVFRHYLWRTIEEVMREEGLTILERYRQDSQDAPTEGGSPGDWEKEFGPAPVRQVFGSTARQGLVVFRNAMMKAGSGNSTYSGSPVQPQGATSFGGVLRFVTQIQIDRFTHAVTRGTRTIAALEVGSTFDCAIEVHNFSWWMVGAVLLTLDAMNDGKLTIGSKGSVGFGRVQVKDISLALRYHKVVPEELFKEWNWPGYGAIHQRLAFKPKGTPDDAPGPLVLWWYDADDGLKVSAKTDRNLHNPFVGQAVSFDTSDVEKIKKGCRQKLVAALRAMTGKHGSRLEANNEAPQT